MADGKTRYLDVDADHAGQRLDRFLAEALPDLSRSHLKALIEDGCVTIEGRKSKPSRPVNAGEEICVDLPPDAPCEALPEDIPLDILYEDDDLLIVNKPKGMTVHPAPGHESGTLVNAVLAHCGESLSGINGVLRPGIVHRIDKDTTGALAICKNDAAHRAVAEQLKTHSITRVYRGIVFGNPPEDEGTVTGNIGRSRRDRKKMAVVTEGGKEAVTHYKVLRRYAKAAYCEFTLETGRTHQIRVHMAHIGHPLLGDTVYGPARQPFATQGQVLHAMVLGFSHPADGHYLEVTAPLPAYFEDILCKLEGGKTWN